VNTDRGRPSGRVTALAERAATAVRRRQQEREPRVVLYDPGGRPRVLPPGARGYDAVLEAGEKLIAAGLAKRKERPERL